MTWPVSSLQSGNDTIFTWYRFQQSQTIGIQQGNCQGEILAASKVAILLTTAGWYRCHQIIEQARLLSETVPLTPIKTRIQALKQLRPEIAGFCVHASQP